MANGPDKRRTKRRYSSSGAVVVNSSWDLVLVMLRPQRLDSFGRPEVRLPKGHIDSGEARLQAALREVAEEAGLSGLCVVADLGHQLVEFEWQGFEYERDESCFLLAVTDASEFSDPEAQFQRHWLTWDKALSTLTYEAEKQWVRNARRSAAQLLGS